MPGFTIDDTPRHGLGAICGEILATVPDWFGIPEANQAYVNFADTHDGWVALANDGSPVGILSGYLHFPETAEIEVLAVRADWHRRGVGRALVDAFERHHRSNGVRILEVKTLGPSREDEGYANTRKFYVSMGFIPIEEMVIWGPENPTLILCKPIDER